MRKAKRVWLVLQALCEIALYEGILWWRGSGSILRRASQQFTAAKHADLELERAICDAVLFATCLHWKPVLCLQRSVCTVRLLRKYGVHARLTIGYRPSPFFCHAWVEVEGRVVGGSAAYQNRLQLLHVV